MKDRDKLPQPNDAAYPVMHCKERDANDCWFYYTYAVNNSTEKEVHVVDTLGKQKVGLAWTRIVEGLCSRSCLLMWLWLLSCKNRRFVYLPTIGVRACFNHGLSIFCKCYFRLPKHSATLFQTAPLVLTSSPLWQGWSLASS